MQDVLHCHPRTCYNIKYMFRLLSVINVAEYLEQNDEWFVLQLVTQI